MRLPGGPRTIARESPPALTSLRGWFCACGASTREIPPVEYRATLARVVVVEDDDGAAVQQCRHDHPEHAARVPSNLRDRHVKNRRPATASRMIRLERSPARRRPCRGLTRRTSRLAHMGRIACQGMLRIGGSNEPISVMCPAGSPPRVGRSRGRVIRGATVTAREAALGHPGRGRRPGRRPR